MDTGFEVDIRAPAKQPPEEFTFWYGESIGALVFRLADDGSSRIAGANLRGVGAVVGSKVVSRTFSACRRASSASSSSRVDDDANLDDAVNGAVSGIFAATGQTCIAGSRLLVQAGVHNEVVERVVDLAKTARMGNPMDVGTQVGPITTRPQFEKVLDYIGIASGEGARLALGGKAATRPECGDGWFVEPTIFTGVDNQMRIAQEEVFGPVLSVIRFETEDEAVAIANDVRFGLGAGVWTSDIGRAFRMSERIQSGTVWVNTYRAVSYLSPFGGYKDSGLGRENGIDAIQEYLQTKSVWINTGAATGNPFVLK
ncbi:aldehyde dehydrogenase family protein [Burkholderia cenocepacia]|uniref:aldehyde dehydrogenase family protein n=1 Tax=Burkholderia cenocepacia TaxID=95486 RepID=UPI003F5129B8